MKNKQQTGFTIVELLIVIVVIGILAAITTVAYNGIQSRANDTAVQSDLRHYAAKVLEYQAINGSLPGAYNNGTARQGLTSFVITTASYSTNAHNFYYCVDTTPGSEVFAVGAVSKSGNMYAYKSVGGLQSYSGVWGASYQHCPGMGIDTYAYSYGFNRDSQSWHSWTR